MNENDVAIICDSQVCLTGNETQVHGRLKCFERVFDGTIVIAAMADPQGFLNVALVHGAQRCSHSRTFSPPPQTGQFA